MNAAIIARLNDKVGPTDVVFLLGDLSFAGVDKTIEVV